MPDVERAWTDQELDDALAALHADVRTSELGAARARAALMAAVTAGAVPDPVRRHRRPVRLLAAAVGIAALVGGGLVVQSGWPGSSGPSASAAELLDRSAGAITVSGDPVVRPGQYLRVVTHAWYATGVEGTWRYLEESRDTMWVPADRDAEWQWARATTGEVRWLTDPATLPPEFGDPGEPTSEVLRAPGGRFYGEAIPEGWSNPTPAFIAALPRDPARLYDRLAVDAQGEPAPRWTTVGNAAEALRTGLLPADVRAAICKALALVPGIRVVDETADLDGRSGVGFGVTDDHGFVHEIIIDPQTGRFIGERDTSPAGLELSSTAVTVDVVDRPDIGPAG